MLAGCCLGGSARAADYVLALSWEPAFCALKGHGAPECAAISRQSYEGNNLVLHGLWPQPEANAYCGVPAEVKAKDQPGRWEALPEVVFARPETRDRLSTYMPGYRSKLDRHEWVKHGTCANMTPDAYFNRAMDLVDDVSQGQTGRMIRASVGRDVTTASLCEALTADFGSEVRKSAQIRTASTEIDGKRLTVMTELWIYLSDAPDGRIGLDRRHLATGYGALNCSDRKVRILAP
jgi:ribonuclease T2